MQKKNANYLLNMLSMLVFSSCFVQQSYAADNGGNSNKKILGVAGLVGALLLGVRAAYQYNESLQRREGVEYLKKMRGPVLYSSTITQCIGYDTKTFMLFYRSGQALVTGQPVREDLRERVKGEYDKVIQSTKSTGLAYTEGFLTNGIHHKNSYVRNFFQGFLASFDNSEKSFSENELIEGTARYLVVHSVDNEASRKDFSEDLLNHCERISKESNAQLLSAVRSGGAAALCAVVAWKSMR